MRGRNNLHILIVETYLICSLQLVVRPSPCEETVLSALLDLIGGTSRNFAMMRALKRIYTMLSPHLNLKNMQNDVLKFTRIFRGVPVLCMQIYWFSCFDMHTSAAKWNSCEFQFVLACFDPNALHSTRPIIPYGRVSRRMENISWVELGRDRGPCF